MQARARMPSVVSSTVPACRRLIRAVRRRYAYSVNDKIPCQRCKKLVLPMTSSRTGGLCMPCFQRPYLPATCSDHPRGIGYWHHGDHARHARFPDPAALVRPHWLPPESRILLLRYLRSAPIFIGSWGHSFCRFDCGASHHVLGAREYWDGAWAWPEGLAHYVECHDVGLPEDFVQRALSESAQDFIDVPPFPGVEVNWDYWLEWADQFRPNDNTRNA